MSKFKIGDKVRCVDASGCRLAIVGKIYTVGSVSDPGGRDGPIAYCNDGVAMFEHRFELADDQISTLKAELAAAKAEIARLTAAVDASKARDAYAAEQLTKGMMR